MGQHYPNGVDFLQKRGDKGALSRIIGGLISGSPSAGFVGLGRCGSLQKKSLYKTQCLSLSYAEDTFAASQGSRSTWVK
jgi:hypothetical protein